MTTLVGCVDTKAGKAGIIVTAEDAMDLIHKGYSHKEDICFYVHRDSIHDEKNKAAFSVSRFKKEHKTHLFNELKVLRSRGTSFLKLDREDKEGVMRHVIAVWKDGEEPDPVCNYIGIVSICGFDSVTKSCYISRVQPGSIYWFHSEENRNRVHDWVTKKRFELEHIKERCLGEDAFNDLSKAQQEEVLAKVEHSMKENSRHYLDEVLDEMIAMHIEEVKEGGC